MVGYRKNALTTLCFQRASRLLKQFHDLHIGIIIECAVHELRVTYHIFKKLVHFTGIGYIASSFAGDINFLAKLFIFL